jgi:hypothetical protein
MFCRCLCDAATGVMQIYGSAQSNFLAAVCTGKCILQLMVPNVIGFTMHLALIV